jgi:hypothetical protein
MNARVVVFSLGLAMLLATWQLWPSDERRIRKLVYEMGEVFDGRPTATDLERAARLAPLARVLASDVVVDELPAEGVVDGTAIHGRDVVVAAAMAGLRQMPDLVVSVTSVDVRVGPGTPKATATAALSISGGVGPGGAWRDVRELKLDLVRESDVWLVTHVAPVRVLTP